MKNLDIEKILSDALPFFGELSDTDKALLVKAARPISLAEGTVVHDGSACTGAILLLNGSLRLYVVSEDGKEITLYRLGAGEICMLSAYCVLDAITFDVTVEADAQSDCVIISPAVLASLGERIPQVKIFTLECALTRFSDVMWVFQQIVFMSMDRRLAIFLCDEAAKTKSDILHLTHEQIAKYVGSAREVVSRMLKYFAAEGIIRYSRAEGIRILDKERLRRLTV